MRASVASGVRCRPAPSWLTATGLLPGPLASLMMTSSGFVGVEVVVSAAFLSGLVAVVVLLARGVPMQCQGPVARPPFRGCRIRVYGFLGRCRTHGLQPGRRLMATVGGSRLLLRRTCAGCGQPTVFRRMQVTGKSYLGCSGYPACKNVHWLNS